MGCAPARDGTFGIALCLGRASFIPVVQHSRAAQRHEEFASIRTRVHLPNPLDTTRACYAASQGTQPYSDQGDRSMGPTFVLLLLLASAGAQTSKDEAAIIAGHEQARKAHLTGNADLLASGIAEKFFEAGRGKVTEKTREQVRRMFAEYFKVANYSVWRDTFPPKVTISGDGKMAWMIVGVHGELTVKDEKTGKSEPTSFESSWIAALQKIDGTWKMVGISSSVKDD